MMGRRVLDDRGAARRIPRPRPSFDGRPRGDLESRIDAVRAKVYGIPSGIGFRIAGGLAFGAVAGLVMHHEVVKHCGPIDGRRAGVALGVLIGLAVLWASVRLGVTQPDLHAVRADLCDLRACLACGYDVRGVPPESDGCTVCPECGAAWRFLTSNPEQETDERAHDPSDR
jgi:hypothetical protein